MDASISFSPSQCLDPSTQYNASTGIEIYAIDELGANGRLTSLEEGFDPDQDTTGHNDGFEFLDMATVNFTTSPQRLEAPRSRQSSTPAARHRLIQSSLPACKRLLHLNLELMADYAWLQSCTLTGDQSGAAFEPERPGGDSPVDRILARASQFLDIIEAIHSIKDQQHPLEQPLEDEIFIKITFVTSYHSLLRIYRAVFNRLYKDFLRTPPKDLNPRSPSKTLTRLNFGNIHINDNVSICQVLLNLSCGMLQRIEKYLGLPTVTSVGRSLARPTALDGVSVVVSLSETLMARENSQTLESEELPLGDVLEKLKGLSTT